VILDAADDRVGLAAFGDETGQFAHDPLARDRRVDDCAQALARDIVDDVEHADASPGRELIVDEIEAPALVGERRHGGGGPRAHGAPAPRPRRPRRRTVGPSSR